MVTPIPAGFGPDSRVTDGPEPLYLQLAAIIAARIERGDYPTGSWLPSGATLQRDFAASRGTVSRALVVLAENGVVRVSNGKGTWVLPPESP